MKKHLSLIMLFFLASGTSLVAQVDLVTVPTTAVSFPSGIIDADSGKIVFFAKLKGFSGSLPVANGAYFFDAKDGRYWTGESCSPPSVNTSVNEYTMGFNANNGITAGGLTGSVGAGIAGGTGVFGYWTYNEIYGSSEAVSKWHCYTFAWNRKGLPDLNREHKFAIYIDGKLNTGFWEDANCNARLIPLIRGTFNLITTYNSSPLQDEIAIDELSIFNGKGKLVLYNTLDSKAAIENSKVGPDGSFNGYGNAHFIKGVKGYAVAANPVYGAAPVSAKAVSADQSFAAGVKPVFKVTVSPNPVYNNILRINAENVSATNIAVFIFDMNGKLFFNKTYRVQNGILNASVNVAAMPKGSYIIKFNTDQFQKSLKFVKEDQ